jgi:peptidyl-tRNA hydrolase, PTH2 family
MTQAIPTAGPPGGTDRRGVKQVIVIRRDLGMRRGKEIAQGSHASMMWLVTRLSWVGRQAGAFFTPAEQEWLSRGVRKVVCVVTTEDELRKVWAEASEAGLESHLVTDAGRTEFHGNPTVTAVAVGPDYDEKIDPVTRHLTLY